MSDLLTQLKELDAKRTKDLGPWEFEPAQPGYITTIFGRYKSGEPADIAYTVNEHDGTDRQNDDARFIAATANALPKLIEAVEAAKEIQRSHYGASHALDGPVWKALQRLDAALKALEQEI